MEGGSRDNNVGTEGVHLRQSFITLIFADRLICFKTLAQLIEIQSDVIKRQEDAFSKVM